MKRNRILRLEKQNISLYLHIPFCIKKCAYCDFLSMPCEKKIQDAYMESLLCEIIEDSILYKEYHVVTIFLGGGTPSVVSTEWIGKILNAIRKHYRVKENVEISMELNPGTVTKEKIKTYLEYGINRFSIGMQTTDNDCLRKLGRIHSYEEFLQTYQWLCEEGAKNINVDVMSALPGQSLEKYCEGLEKIVNLPQKPTHISAYSLILEEGTPFYTKYVEDGKENLLKEELLPDEETERKMYVSTGEILNQYGYHRYEISNYALDGYECIHNKRYWTRDTYIGFGIGAASLFLRHRIKNHSNIHEYIKSKGHPKKEEDITLTLREEMEEFMFLGLRMMNGVKRKTFLEQFGVAMEEIYGLQIESLKKQGLILEDDSIKLTTRGIDVSNYVFEKFLE